MYYKVINILRAERDRNTQFNDWAKLQELNYGCEFETLLITRVQHASRYQIFLQNAIKFTDENSIEMQNLQQYFKGVIFKNVEIDKAVTAVEEKKQMNFIQEQLEGFKVIKQGRRLLFHGTVLQLQKKNKNLFDNFE
jgi:hypothetical protein